MIKVWVEPKQHIRTLKIYIYICTVQNSGFEYNVYTLAIPVVHEHLKASD